MSGTFSGGVALASVNFPAPGAPAFRLQSGDFASLSLIGPGLVRLVFQEGIAPSDGAPSLSVRDPLGGSAVLAEWNSVYLEVQTYDVAGAAAERGFDLAVLQQPNAVPIYVPPPPPPPPPPPGPPLADLIGWWKADGILGLNNGDPVLNWPDDSGTGNDLNGTGGFPGVEPTYVASDALLNNQPAVSFNGSQWILKVGAPLGMPVGNTAVTVYSVSYTTAAVTKIVWYWGTTLGGFPGASVGFSTHPFVPHSILINNNGRTWGALPNPVGTPCVAAWAHTAGADVAADPLYVDGATGPSTIPALPGALDMTPVPNWTLSFGFYGPAPGPLDFQGSIAEVLVYKATHDLATLTSVTNYLKAKWGIP